MAWSGGFCAQQTAGFGGDRDRPPAKIENLVPGKPTDLLVGVVIAKEEYKSFASKKDPSKENFLQSFTIRDSAKDFINVTCWGGSAFIQNMKEQFKIGDIVEIQNPMVQSKPTNGSDEKFRPRTPCPYQLSLSENHSTVRLYTGWDSDEYTKYYHMPVKPGNDYYTIEDVLANGAGLNGELINMLAMVKFVSPAKEITTKQGKKKKRCEVKVFDESAPSFSVTLWDEELIHLAQTWSPREHVVFLADVRVGENAYQKTMTATACTKTIITTNPDSREAHTLFQYAQTVELPMEEGTLLSGAGGGQEMNVDLSSIQTVCTIEQVKERLTMKGDGGADYVIVYAMLTSLDLDRDDQAGIKTRCGKCRYRMDPIMGTCTNKDCVQGIESDVIPEVMEAETLFDLRINLTDYTGTLDGCILSGKVVENMLNCKVDAFLTMTEEEKTNIKWKYLLERCKIYLKLSRSFKDETKSFIKILSCEIADLREAVKFTQ